MSKIFIAVAFVSMLGFTRALSATSCKADLSFVHEEFCISDLNVSNANQLPEVPLKYDWKISGSRFDLQFKSCIATKKNQLLPQNILIAIDKSSTFAVADSENFQKASRSIELAKKVIEQIKAEALLRRSPVNVGIMMFSGSDECQAYSSATIETENGFPCLYAPMKSTSVPSHLTYLTSFLTAADMKYAPQNDSNGSDFTLIADVLEKTATDQNAGPVAVLLVTDGKIYTGSEDEEFSYLRSENYLVAQKNLLKKFEKTFAIPMTLNVALLGQTYNSYDAQFKSSYENYCALNPNSEDCRGTVAMDKPSTWPVNGVAVKPFLESLVVKTGKSASGLVAVDRLSNDLAASNLFSQLKESAEKLVNASIVKPNGERIQSELVDGQLLFKGLDVEDSSRLEIHFGEADAADQIVVPMDLNFTQAGYINEANSTPDEMICRQSITSTNKNIFEKLTCGTIGDKGEQGRNASDVMYFLILLLPVCFSFLKRDVRSH